MAKANAQIEIRANSSHLSAGLSAAQSKFKAFAGSVARGTGQAFKSLGGDTAKRALGNFGGDLLGRGLDFAVGAANDVRDFERNLTRLGIATGQAGPQLDVMRKSIRDLSVETGVNSAEILAATTKYVDLTGDVKGATAAQRSFARITQATGASMSDVAEASAALTDAMQIKPDQLEATFSGLIQQGKAGAVTVKDLAREVTALAPLFTRFKGSMGREGALQLSAALQVARKGFGSASEAGTGMKALITSITQNAKKFEAVGVKVFDKDPKTGVKTMRNLHDIITEVGKSKLAKDPTLLGKAFGSQEASATYGQLVRLAPLYDQLIEAGKDRNAVERDYNTFMQSDAGKIDAAFNTMKETIAQAFTPERIKLFTEALVKVSEAIVAIVGGVEKLLSKLDGSEMGKQLGEKIAFANRNLTPQQKVAKAQELMVKSRELDGAVGEKTLERKMQIASYEHAATMLEKQSGFRMAENDPWRQNSRGAADMVQATKAVNEGALTKEIADLLRDLPSQIRKGMDGAARRIPGTTVQLGDNQVAHSVNKSTNARRSTH